LETSRIDAVSVEEGNSGSGILPGVFDPTEQLVDFVVLVELSRVDAETDDEVLTDGDGIPVGGGGGELRSML
jgi:hypothetical protein